ncbi:MAG: hypothetical protein IPI46_01810 [Bacteroidetes bacterium]|nr:hypothetical protein [Bacteroidota bacterium]
MNMSNLLLSVIFLFLFTSCIKYKTKYKCESNCEQLTIKLNVDNASNLNVLSNTTYEIVLLDNFPGSSQNIRVMGKGTSDQNGNFTTTVSCDTGLLNTDDYYIKVNYVWDVNTIKVCYDSITNFKIENYPMGGIHNINITSYKKIISGLDFIKKSSDSIKSAHFYIGVDCFSSTGYSLYTAINIPQHIDAQTIFNRMNYINLTITDTFNVSQIIKDSFYVDNTFTGKIIEF